MINEYVVVQNGKEIGRFYAGTNVIFPAGKDIEIYSAEKSELWGEELIKQNIAEEWIESRPGSSIARLAQEVIEKGGN